MWKLIEEVLTFLIQRCFFDQILRAFRTCFTMKLSKSHHNYFSQSEPYHSLSFCLKTLVSSCFNYLPKLDYQWEICKFQICLRISAAFKVLAWEFYLYPSEMYFQFQRTTFRIVLFSRTISNKTASLALFPLPATICSLGVGDSFPLGRTIIFFLTILL